MHRPSVASTVGRGVGRGVGGGWALLACGIGGLGASEQDATHRPGDDGDPATSGRGRRVPMIRIQAIGPDGSVLVIPGPRAPQSQ